MYMQSGVSINMMILSMHQSIYILMNEIDINILIVNRKYIKN